MKSLQCQRLRFPAIDGHHYTHGHHGSLNAVILRRQVDEAVSESIGGHHARHNIHMFTVDCFYHMPVRL